VSSAWRHPVPAEARCHNRGKGIHVYGATARWGGRRSNDRVRYRTRGIFDHVSTTHATQSCIRIAGRTQAGRAHLRARVAGFDRGRHLAAPASDSGVDAQAAAQVGGGQYIADFALQFQGYPYVWAGNGPGGFDCSGFTQYVLLNTVGIDIGHGVAEQTYSGAWVNWGEWQPGDLVYFAGTYRPGISHTGVYIGDGQFIHAENEGTGVVISSVYSDYYAGHYYGAYRHW